MTPPLFSIQKFQQKSVHFLSENMSDFGVKFRIEEIITRIGYTERVLREKCLRGWTLVCVSERTC